MTALELVPSLSETELTAVCAAINLNTIHNGPEVSAATNHDANVKQEAIQVLTKLH